MVQQYFTTKEDFKIKQNILLDKHCLFTKIIEKTNSVQINTYEYRYFKGLDTLLIVFSNTGKDIFTRNDDEEKRIYYENEEYSYYDKKSKVFLNKSGIFNHYQLSLAFINYYINNNKSAHIYKNNKPYTGIIYIKCPYSFERNKAKQRVVFKNKEMHFSENIEIFLFYSLNKKDHSQSNHENIEINSANGNILHYSETDCELRFIDNKLQFRKLNHVNSYDDYWITLYKNHKLNGIQKSQIISNIIANYNNWRYSHSNNSYADTTAYEMDRKDYNYDNSSDESELWLINNYSNEKTQMEVPTAEGKIIGNVSLISQIESHNIPFTNDTINGTFTITRAKQTYPRKKPDEYYTYTVNSDSINFKMGKLHGRTVSYYPYNIDAGSLELLAKQNWIYGKTFPYRAQLNFVNNQLYGKQLYYYPNGNVKAEVLVDTFDHTTWGKYTAEDDQVTFLFEKENKSDSSVKAEYSENHYYNNRSSSTYDTRTIKINKDASNFTMDNFESVLYTYNNTQKGLHKTYYNDGVLQEEGRVNNLRRTGLWKYYGENGKLFKEIIYYDSATPKPYINDTINAYGYVVNYDKNGNKIHEGYVRDQQFEGACVSLQEISIEDIAYTKIYINNKENSVTEESYYPIYEYQITGNKRYDGFLKGGEKDSLWKYYANNGSIETVGKYINGERNGRWLSGDLTGINFLDNMCFNPADSMYVKRMMKNLEITETIYIDGEVETRAESHINTDGFSKANVELEDIYFIKVKEKRYRFQKLKRKIRSIFRKRYRYDDYSEAAIYH